MNTIPIAFALVSIILSSANTALSFQLNTRSDNTLLARGRKQRPASKFKFNSNSKNRRTPSPTSRSSDLMYKDDDDIEVIKPKRKSRVVSSTQDSIPIANLLTVETLEDYKECMELNKDKIIIIRFYAPWCKACKAIAPSFYRLARKNPRAVFVDIPVTSKNEELHQKLNIPSVPFGHIYHSNQLFEEKQITKKNWTSFEETAYTYLKGYCVVDELSYDAHLPF
jgi:thiol-disulfide isomerase/thioredoxin